MFAGITKAQVFTKGAKFAHVGIGVGSPYVYSGSSVTMPPIHGSVEFGVSDKIGVGGVIGYTGSKYESSFGTGNYTWKFNYLIFGARGAYHFGIKNDKTDVYAGAMLGYNKATSKFESNVVDESLVGTSDVGGVVFGAFVGARYMFKDNIGGFAELGYNIAWLNLGLTLKL